MSPIQNDVYRVWAEGKYREMTVSVCGRTVRSWYTLVWPALASSLDELTKPVDNPIYYIPAVHLTCFRSWMVELLTREHRFGNGSIALLLGAIVG
jgi:hypothetical protein